MDYSAEVDDMVNGVTSEIYIYPFGAADHGAEG
jgi:hypothetical protein